MRDEKMLIGIMGLGIVGGAVRYGLEKLGHHVAVHDLKLDTRLEDVLESSICFVCVPTPSAEDGSCDTSIVRQVVSELHVTQYQGVIAIKSTCSPGTTQQLIEEYENEKICFVPEFLRERCACSDFFENHDVCMIGTERREVFELVRDVHGKIPKQVVQLPPTEAELAKYFNNLYNATLVTFANSFHEVCVAAGANYTTVKEAIVLREHIRDIYLDCNDNFRGFGGGCLPKDTKAIAVFCRKHGIPVEFFQTLLDENAKYKMTVFDGMREQ